MKKEFKITAPAISSFFGKTVFIAMLFISLMSFNASAGITAGSERAENSLKKDFANAKNISWKMSKDFIKAEFSWNSQRMEVYYDTEGKTLAVSRIINENVLPLKAQLNIMKKYPDYTVTEAIECSDPNEGNCYYVSIKNDKKQRILQIDMDGNVNRYQGESKLR